MLQNLKLSIGKILVSLLPADAKRLQQEGMTLIVEDNLTHKERLMRLALLDRLEKEKNFDHLSSLHKNYWRNRGGEYFEITDNNFETIFLPDCSFIIDELVDQLGENHSYNRFIEIGTGNGDVLTYCSTKLPEIAEFVGIDLSPDQIELNKQKNVQQNLNFVAADAAQWIPEHGRSNTIYLTSRGVLEYFTEPDLLQLLSSISGHGDVLFVAIEPVDLSHDLENNPHSMLYGGERSFSHNYFALFGKAGFSINHSAEKIYSENDHKLLFIIAQST